MSTAAYASKSKSIAAQETTPKDVFFKSDGLKMYVLGDDLNRIFQYTLSTAWDVSTASYDSVKYSVSSEDTNPSGFFFSSDGRKMYVAGQVTGTVLNIGGGFGL